MIILYLNAVKVTDTQMMHYDPAQKDAPKKVVVCFDDPVIRYLFVDLLHSHGAKVELSSELKDAPSSDRIITEQRHFEALRPETRKRCVVIVDPDTPSPSYSAAVLRRPLTEEKLTAAVSELLR